MFIATLPRILVLSFVFAMSVLSVSADRITLKSGAVEEGRIVDETESEVHLEVANPQRTIFIKRIIKKTDIAQIDRDSAADIAAEEAFQALLEFKVFADKEYSPAAYASMIREHENYLSEYHDSTQANEVQTRLRFWREEQQMVLQGKVKYQNEWLEPEEKRQRICQDQLQTLSQEISNLRKRLQEKKNALARDTARQRSLRSAIAKMPDTIEWQGFGDKKTVVANKEKIKAQQDLGFLERNLPKWRTEVQNFEQQIPRLEQQLQSKRGECQGVRAPDQLPSGQAPSDQLMPWWKRYWKWLLLGILLLLVYLFRR